MSAAAVAGLIEAAATQREAMRALLPLLAEAGIVDGEAELPAIWREANRDNGGWNADNRNRFAAYVSGRLKRIPLDRLVGERGFWTLDLALNNATLSPRPDTETLVQAALSRLGKQDRGSKAIRILDLGTGSGAILLALLAELPAATGLGVDVSEQAVAIASANAKRNAAVSPGLAERAAFRVSDWFCAVEGAFDLILSNPPYIASASIAGLEPEVRLHDPLLALDGGEDGLAAYRTILAGARRFSAPGGGLLLEIGHDQAVAVTALAKAEGYRRDGLHRDLGGNDRVLEFTIEQ